MAALQDTNKPRVFLVEDESLVAMLIEDMLDEIGYSLAGHASSVTEGVNLAQRVDAEVCILDVNIAGVSVFPIAEVLAARGIPFLFSTGYGAAGIPPRWAGYTVISKPFDISTMAQALQALVERSMVAKSA